ncbi:hypothetical protein [Paraburkholderia nodosa]|uniref:hypothetical protein n=1 Tax=Paraburkholderia nodosa TaxID=392320 RepID=UPI0008417B45|nr:hypothetical protein [Paraburkholderia nodosa]
MYQYDDPTAVSALPTPAAAGTSGYFTDGNPAQAEAATVLRSDFMNMLMLELLNVVEAAGISPSKTAYNQVLLAIKSLTSSYAAGSYSVRKMVAANNGATPNTQFDTSCDLVVVRNPTTGACAAISNPGVITNNILTAGPVANGRDVAGAFAASTWLHFYYVWNGTTLATISSASAPPTGPALPNGYTSWAYIGAVYLNASSQLMLVRQRGSWIMYADQQAVITGGSSTSVAAITTATLTPPNAVQFELSVPNLSINATAAGPAGLTLIIQVESSHSPFQMGIQGSGAASATWGTSGASKRFPAITQGFNYQIAILAGSGQSVTIDVTGYSVPNGGE